LIRRVLFPSSRYCASLVARGTRSKKATPRSTVLCIDSFSPSISLMPDRGHAKAYVLNTACPKTAGNQKNSHGCMSACLRVIHRGGDWGSGKKKGSARFAGNAKRDFLGGSGCLRSRRHCFHKADGPRGTSIVLTGAKDEQIFYFFGGEIISFAALATRNLTTVLAGILIGSPV